MRRLLVIVAGLAVLGAFSVTFAADEKARVKPGPNKADEAKAKVASLEKGTAFLDAVALNWTRNRKCATCHTNVPYLMARPALKGKASDEEKEVRKFFEGRVAAWDAGKKDGPAYVVATATALAVHDARTTGKLHPTTRKALDHIWPLQTKNGAWNWLKCNWPPYEHDDYYGAVLAALGVGMAPDGYAQSEKAKAGVEKLKGYFAKTPPPSLHHKALLMWASLKLDSLMSKADREKTSKELLAIQKADGGWSLPSLGDWKGFDGRENDTKRPSDGYATGLVMYVLRQAGLPADHAAMKKGVGWLKANQRISGRWFTQSLNTDRTHYITHAGTAYALLALKACGE
jgi:squalene-hopene/tetraprenyl-beta-curcumene cyclase